MRIGLTSVTFRDKSVEEIIKIATDNNLDGIEWGGDIHIPCGDIKTAIKVRELSSIANIEVFSYGSYYKGLPEQDFSLTVNTAIALGAKIIRIWAGNKSYENMTEMEYNSIVESIKNACNLARENGMKLALEYHRNTLTQSKESALGLLNAVNNESLFLYWQPNPDIDFKEHIAEITLLKDYICCYHIFAWEHNNTRLYLEDHKENWMKYIDLICDNSNINYILEFVKDDSVEVFSKDVLTLKDIKNTLGLEVKSKKKAVFMCNAKRVFTVYNMDALHKIDELFELPRIFINTSNIDKYKHTLKNVEYIFSTWGMPHLSENEIDEYLPNLKAVFYGAGSVRSFAKPFFNKNIRIISGWVANSVPVSEFTVAQIVLAGKGYFQNVRKLLSYDRETAVQYFREQEGNYNIKIGILGAGAVGKGVLQMLQSYKFELYVYDPYFTYEQATKLNVKKVELNEIFTICNVISNHIANIPSTVGMLKYQHFSNMKKYSTFINTGRADQVVEKDLIKAFSEDTTKTALLDVEVDTEVCIEGNPLLTMENVFLSTHLAGSSGNEFSRIGEYIFEDAIKLLNNQPCEFEITLQMLENMA